MQFKKPKISKRKRFVIASTMLSAGLVFLTEALLSKSISHSPGVYTIMASITYLLTYWSLREDIKGTERVTLFTIPILYTLGTLAFSQTLPELRRYRYPLIVAYPIAIYAILLTNNIFNVAVIRTIQLLRAARAVSYLMTLVTAYLCVAAISSTQTDVFTKCILVATTLHLLTFQFFWAFDLGRGNSRKVHLYAFTTTILLTQMCLVLQITPSSPQLESLFLITTMYCLLGICAHHLERKLTQRIALEYIGIATIIILGITLTFPWAG